VSHVLRARKRITHAKFQSDLQDLLERTGPPLARVDTVWGAAYNRPSH